MRINKFVASCSNLSRRKADEAISSGRVLINGQRPELGGQTAPDDTITLDGQILRPMSKLTTIMLNKPAGYIVSRDGQGSQTIYDILPAEHQDLQPIGRLDKNSSGLLLLTSDGALANELTHPSRQKTKIYQVNLDQSLQPLHQQMISDFGIDLEDGPSKFVVEKSNGNTAYQITMHEGRNRQIRRTFAVLGYKVTRLHRTQFGNYTLASLATGKVKPV